MKELMYKLFAYKYFPDILGIIIIILIIAFIIVYYWGKKDQKLIETRKLEKIKNIPEDTLEESSEENEIIEEIPLEEDAFKEVSKPRKVEFLEENTFNSEEDYSSKLNHHKVIKIKKVTIPEIYEEPPTYEEEPYDVPEDIIELPKNETPEINHLFDNSNTIEFPKLNNNDKLKTVSIDDFERISNSIGKELKNLENLEKLSKKKESSFFETDENDIELPKLK